MVGHRFFVAAALALTLSASSAYADTITEEVAFAPSATEQTAPESLQEGKEQAVTAEPPSTHRPAASLSSRYMEQESVGLERASQEQITKATAHYARARSLLISAIQEFDAGYAIANTDAILDSKSFRSGMLSRAKDLERVLAPQPRATKNGMRFNADQRLIGRQR